MSFVRHLFNVYRVKKKERKNETEREGREVNEKKGKNGWMGGKERPETSFHNEINADVAR